MADKILQSINFPGLPDTYIIPNNTDNLAPTEYSPATKAHAVGDIFLLNGVLYRTTSAIAIGDTISSVGMGANVVKTDVADELERDVDISDVRINNTSIVSNTVANIPVANAATAGVVRVNSTYGISSSGGLLYTNPANSNDIKGGNENYKPVVPTTQHESAFYGLAKAAGDTTQAQSSNPVGTYTDDAKAAIKSMLDISGSGGGAVEDVQIGGNSIIDGYGVANIPWAGESARGVVKADTQYGVGLTDYAEMTTVAANEDDIQAGTDEYKPIVPLYQHESVFYGLAKAAGDNTQSEADTQDYPVGTYTDDAKAAIKSMLDISETGGSVQPDGYYQQMTVGNAEQLVATVGIEDKVPYNFRTSGGSNDIGDREVDKLVGGTVAWNQLYTIDSTDRTITNKGVTLTDNRDGTYVLNGTATETSNVTLKGYTSIPIGHVFAMWGFKATTGCWMGFAGYILDTGNGGIWKNNTVYAQLSVRVDFPSGAVFDNVTIRPQYCDLTQMFGSTIADYIYSLETATAGAGVAYFRKLFPKPYYAYNAGELMSVQTSGHKMVGFNAFDKDNADIAQGSFDAKSSTTTNVATYNYTPIVGGAVYNYHSFVPTAGGRYIRFYDASKNLIGNTKSIYTVYLDNEFTTPADARYIRLLWYSSIGCSVADVMNGDVCIHLKWDGERNGEYEPYEEHVYPLDSDLVLRGIPKLDANNNLYYDGDEYADDGTVTRRYGIVDLGTLDWSYSSGSGQMYAIISDMVTANNPAVVCAKYTQVIVSGWADITVDRTLAVGGGQIRILDTSYTDATTFTTAMSGVYFVYPLATQTTEEADPYTNPQIVDDWGTEEYIDERTIPIPVGHDTMYRANLRAKLEMAPDSPDGDGDYIVRQTNGQNEYVLHEHELPTAPTTDGTYHLKLTVSGTTKTLAWEADT